MAWEASDLRTGRWSGEFTMAVALGSVFRGHGPFAQPKDFLLSGCLGQRLRRKPSWEALLPGIPSLKKSLEGPWRKAVAAGHPALGVLSCGQGLRSQGGSNMAVQSRDPGPDFLGRSLLCHFAEPVIPGSLALSVPGSLSCKVDVVMMKYLDRKSVV